MTADMTDAIWITPAEALRLVASYKEAGGTLETKVALLMWIGQGKIATMALEFTQHSMEQRRVGLTPPALSGSLSPSPTPKASDDSLLPAYRVNPAYRPPRPEDMVATRKEVTDYKMSAEEWLNVIGSAADADLDAMWSSSEVTHSAVGRGNTIIGFTYAGIRFSEHDIKRRIAIAGWSTPTPAAPRDGAESGEDESVTALPPSKNELEKWARDWHQSAITAGTSVDWNRAGQDDLRRRFPDVKWKQGTALNIARDCGLARGYSR